MDKKRPKPADGSSPFEGMNIASHDALAALKQRSKCSECGSSRKYFCYTCYIPVPKLKGNIPIVKLPVKVDIIKHSREVDGKSTAIHAAVLAPDDVNMYTYPSIPNYDDPSERVVLVYPSNDAVSLEELTQRLARQQDTTKDQSEAAWFSLDEKAIGKTQVFSLQKQIGRVPVQATQATDDKIKEAGCPFQKVIFIDCTWNQTNQIYRDERLRGLQCVVVKDRKTCFWRGQHKAESYLATIEAIYYFMVDYHRAFMVKESSDAGCYDNLLYFYSFMYGLVYQDDREDAKRNKVENG